MLPPSVHQAFTSGSKSLGVFGASHVARHLREFGTKVREFGMEGDLMAFPRTPSCAVANPAVWIPSDRVVVFPRPGRGV